MNHMEVANRKESNRRKTKASLNNSMRGEVNSKMSMENTKSTVSPVSGSAHNLLMRKHSNDYQHNLEYLKNFFKVSSNITQEMTDLLLDPQTSGGLLLSMPEKDALEYVSRMELFNPWTKIIGEVTDKKDYSIIIK